MTPEDQARLAEGAREGYVLVPLDPTPEMVEAGRKAFAQGDPIHVSHARVMWIWMDMLDAATAGKPAGEMAAMVDKAAAFDMCVKRSTERDAAEQRVAEQDIMIGNLTTAYEESRAETVAAEKRVAELERQRLERFALLQTCEAEVATLRTALTAAEGALGKAAHRFELLDGNPGAVDCGAAARQIREHFRPARHAGQGGRR